jgi:hypothetical protein
MPEVIEYKVEDRITAGIIVYFLPKDLEKPYTAKWTDKDRQTSGEDSGICRLIQKKGILLKRSIAILETLDNNNLKLTLKKGASQKDRDYLTDLIKNLVEQQDQTAKQFKNMKLAEL